MGIMPAMEVVVRAARPEDPVDGLLFTSAAPYYAAYAGGPERARRLLRTALRLRGVAFRGERGRTYADAARWLGSARVEALLEEPRGP